MPNEFRLMHVTRAVVDEVNELLDRSSPRLLHDVQLRNSADSIASNVREAYGRRAGPERNQFFRYAHGSAEETDEHLRSNYAARHLDAKRFWRVHNRLTVIVRMLTSLMGE